jgi:hypothetical protein
MYWMLGMGGTDYRSKPARGRPTNSGYPFSLLPDPNLPEPPEKVVIDDPPPFLGTWPHVYVFVVIYLVVLISAFYVFARTFAP